MVIGRSVSFSDPCDPREGAWGAPSTPKSPLQNFFASPQVFKNFVCVLRPQEFFFAIFFFQLLKTNHLVSKCDESRHGMIVTRRRSFFAKWFSFLRFSISLCGWFGEKLTSGNNISDLGNVFFVVPISFLRLWRDVLLGSVLLLFKPKVWSFPDVGGVNNCWQLDQHDTILLQDNFPLAHSCLW